MKALTFIETWQQCQKSKITYRKVIDYEKIVSQTFNPEMILELFDRFELSGYKRYTHKAYNVCISFGVDNMYLSVYGILRSTPINPKTINDFISDCTRAGIELEWKKGIWE